ncbi:LysR family transcriptional regulator [Neorhizobium sp. NCHU2750]|uniref:LysR family transcriptional regulator n=1 Tax=Neorhizobium sp. NCHU2750 TaxID=1825976 RepID=UPI001FE052C4
MGSAARDLGISQSAVSQQISRLETMLDLKLIDRDAKGFRLLPAGRTFEHHARRVIRELDATERAMQEFHGFKFANLSIRIMDSLSKTLSNEVVKALHGAVEQMQIGAAAVHRHREDFLAGTVDMLITSLDFDPDTFEIHHIATEPLVLIAPKGAVSADSFELDDLASMLPFVHYANQRYLGVIADRYLARQMVNVVRSIEVDQATAVIDTVRYGRAWAITSPFSLLDQSFDEQDIEVLALPKPVPTRPIDLVIRPGALSDLARTLATRCRQYLMQQMKMDLCRIVPAEAMPIVSSETGR